MEAEHRRSTMIRRQALAVAAIALVVGAGLILRTVPLAGVAGPSASADAHVAAGAGTAAARATPVPGERPRRTSAEADADAVATAIDAHMRQLAAEGDSHQRAVALYLLLRGSTDPVALRRAHDLVASLLAESPDDEWLALALTWFCGDAPRPTCTDADRAAWRTVAPGNAAAYFGEMQRFAGDAASVDMLLARAANGSTYESHMQATLLETVAAFDGLGLPPITHGERVTLAELGMPATEANRRQLLATLTAAIMPIQPMNAIMRACRPPLSPTRRHNCDVFLRRMLAGGTTLIEQGVALAGLRNLWQGTPDGANWAREYLDSRWRRSQLAALELDGRYWDDVVRYGERTALDRALMRSGIPLRAPPGWQPL